MPEIEFTSSKDKIPKGYKSYTLFLIPSSDWDKDSTRQIVEKMSSNFRNFGESIGSDNLAVWFVIFISDMGKLGHHTFYDIWPDKEKLSLYEEFQTDYIRSKEYCDKYNLSYNDGPYVVFTTKHPDRATLNDLIILQLNNIRPNRFILLLNDLEQGIRRNEINKKTKTLKIKNYYEILYKVISSNAEFMKQVALKIYK
jgi:hypothetical protein